VTDYSWRAAEAARPNTQLYEITRGGSPVATLEVRGKLPNPSLVLGPLCDAMAGPAVKPDSPLGEPDERRITDKQRAKIHIDLAELNPLYYRDRDERLRYVSRVVGRTVGSTNDLTRVEASMVIDSIADANRWKTRVER
jgi:hypothetical protein